MDLRALLEMHNAVVSLLRMQVVTGTGKPEVKFAEGNVTIILPSTGAGSAVSAFAITELGHSDYFIARKLSNLRLVDGAPTFDVGSQDFKIAKPIMVRRSIVSEQLYGSTVTYRDDGDTDNTRIGNDGVKDESQVVIPPYITIGTLGLSDTVPANSQCVVYAEEVPGLAGVFDEDSKEVTWLESTDGVRVFAKKFITP